MSSWRGELTNRLATLKLRPEREAEIVEELTQHLDDHVRELIAGGADPETARTIALAELDQPGELARRLGMVERHSPYALPQPGAPSRARWLSALRHDVSYAIASLRRTPAFALTVIVTMALTIGPTTAMLSVANWLLWRPAPGVVQADRLAVVWFGEWSKDGSVGPRRISPANLDDLVHASRTFTDIAGWQESTISFAVEGVPPRRVGSAHVSAHFFALLGIRPVAGRTFVADDDRPPYGSPVAIVSESLAREMFGAAATAVGHAVTINGARLTVVGVMPHGFNGLRPASHTDVWLPSSTSYYVRHFSEAAMRSRKGRAGSGIFYMFVTRLAPGATFDAMQAELDVLVPSLARQYPDDNRSLTATRARVFPGLGMDELERASLAILVRRLLLIGGVLLLLGCTNVANLQISRGLQREPDRAIRAALGASRSRLAQLALVESCLLSLAGAAAGIALALWLKDLVQTLVVPGLDDGAARNIAPMDLRVLMSTVGLSLACGLLAGVVPAWIASAGAVTARLRRRGRQAFARRLRIRTILSSAQLALALALVTNAILLVATLHRLIDADPGFDPHAVSVHSVDVGSHGYTTDRALTYDRQLIDSLSADRAINDVSLSWVYPPMHFFRTRLLDTNGRAIDVAVEPVSDGYFRTLRQPILAGRAFTRDEAFSSGAPNGRPVVVSASLAQRLFGTTSPLGQRVSVPPTMMSPAHQLVVIGVAGDTRSIGNVVSGESDLEMYTPLSYEDGAVIQPVVLVRSRLSPRDAGTLVQTHASRLDPSLPFEPPRALTTTMTQTLSDRRALAWVLSGLGALGFILAAVGLSGLLTQMVGERTREFGVRLAIGAQREHVVRLVLRQAMWIAACGGIAGLVLAALGSRIVASQLFGVTRLQPWVYIASAIGFTIVVLAASFWPARAASAIEPARALRAE
jgi:predicted permease